MIQSLWIMAYKMSSRHDAEDACSRGVKVYQHYCGTTSVKLLLEKGMEMVKKRKRKQINNK